MRILRRDIDRIGFDKDFTIYDTDDSKRVIRDILKELNLEDVYKRQHLSSAAPQTITSARYMSCFMEKCPPVSDYW